MAFAGLKKAPSKILSAEHMPHFDEKFDYAEAANLMEHEIESEDFPKNSTSQHVKSLEIEYLKSEPCETSRPKFCFYMIKNDN